MIKIIGNAMASAFRSTQKSLEAGIAVNGIVKLAMKGKRVYAYLDVIGPASCLGMVDGINAIPDGYNVRVKGLATEESGKKVIIAELTSDEDALKPTASSSEEAADEFSADVERIVSNGIASEEEVKTAVQVMQENAVPAVVTHEVLNRWHTRTRTHQPKLFYRNTKGKGEESFLTSALMSAILGYGLVLEGPKSTGKNVFAETLAFCLHLPYDRLNFTRDMLLEDVFGSKGTDNSAADGLTPELAKAYTMAKLIPGSATSVLDKAAEFELLKAKSASVQIVHTESTIINWAKQGGVLMFDEVNMADANLLQQILNPLTDTEKVLVVPGEGEIKMHPECVVIAGMNPGYAGTCEMNEATASRMGVLKFEYSGSIEEPLKANFPGNKKAEKLIGICDRLYNRCTSMVNNGTISDRCLNIRGYVHALDVYLRFEGATSLQQQLITYVVNGCEADEREKVLAVLLDTIPKAKEAKL